MATAEGERGFFAYYREYAQSGIHAASAAALTVFIGLAGLVNRWFVVLAVGVYVLPPVFLYLSREGERVPSVVGDRDTDGTDDEHEPEHAGDTTPEIDHEPAPDDPGSEPRSEPGPAVAETGGDGSESDAGERESEEDGVDAEPRWGEVDTPTTQSLLDVVSVRESAYAVGEGGVVLARTGDTWEVVVERGPTAESNPLRGVDATADGEAVWFAGDSGVLGRYLGGKLTDHSAPADQTSTWTDVAVTGDTGEERVYLVNGSGELLRGRYEDGSVSWGDIEKPGSGSSISAIAFADADRGHLCDTNHGVYETTNGSDEYEKIGIEDANAAFTGVAATDSMVVVSCDDGSVFRYDGSVWTRLHAAENALSSVDLADESGLAAGDAGAVVELVNGSWESAETPVETDLAGIVVGDTDSPDIAVGTDGTVIERQR